MKTTRTPFNRVFPGSHSENRKVHIPSPGVKSKNGNLLWVFPLMITGMLIFTGSCNKEDSELLRPSPQTYGVFNITKTTAVCGGYFISDGGADISAKGICWSEHAYPSLEDNVIPGGTGSGSFACDLTGLTAGTLYYVRAYATNMAGTGYGNKHLFATLPDVTYDSISDTEGNIYNTVQIGAQVWMAENLRATLYNDGTPIPECTHWPDDSLAYCWYEGDPERFKETYGALYTSSVFNTTVNGGKNVCPSGWHVPDQEEWSELIDYLGGSEIAGKKLKESGNSHWSSPNIATNASGFSALPGGWGQPGLWGIRFTEMGESGHWWSNGSDDNFSPWIWTMHCNDPIISEFLAGNDRRNEFLGLSIRCVRD